MAHDGTLILTDDDGSERRVICGGGLDSYVDDDGGTRVRGVVNVRGEAAEEARRIMEGVREGKSPMARYSGEIYTIDRRDVRSVEDMRVRIQGIDETGNVRIESDETLSA